MIEGPSMINPMFTSPPATRPPSRPTMFLNTVIMGNSLDDANGQLASYRVSGELIENASRALEVRAIATAKDVCRPALRHARCRSCRVTTENHRRGSLLRYEGVEKLVTDIRNQQAAFFLRPDGFSIKERAQVVKRIR